MTSTIQVRLNRGLAKGAALLGQAYCWYRPVYPLTPIQSPLEVILADFDTDPKFNHTAPARHGNPIYYGLFDAALMQTGDYLVGVDGSYFVAALEPDKPPLCTRCNATISISRPGHATAGAGYYSGDLRTDETPLMTGWPASLLQGVRGEKGLSGLPGDTRMPWAAVLVPSFPGVTILQADRIDDDLGRRWTVSSSELTNHGWRLTLQLANN